jgi:hypothetical protein
MGNVEYFGDIKRYFQFTEILKNNFGQVFLKGQ